MNLKKLAEYKSVFIGIVFLAVLLFHGRLKDYDEGRYNNPPPKEIVALNKMKFENATEKMGLGDVVHHLYFPNKEPIVQKYLPFIGIPTYLSVFDLNKDGYMDLFFTEPSPDVPDRVFLNDKGKKFVEITDKMSVLAQKGPMGTDISVWADFNNDGKLDFFTTDTPCYTLYLQKENLQFEPAPSKPEYCSVPFSLNVLDFNRDGNLDIAVANYYPEEVIHDPKIIYQQLVGRAGKFSKGEPNFIFLGDGKGNFEFFQPQALIPPEGRSTSVGFSYINDDLWPDIYMSNDFTFDEMYLNMEGKDLQDVTGAFIPMNYHGFSGMNSDFADVNNDGLLDLYVTNGWGPPSATSENLLWQKKNQGFGYAEAGRRMGADKCGWGWGAKFADFDLDGDLDLFVTNGRGHGDKAKSFKESSSANYLRTQVRSVPLFLREKLFSIGDSVAPDMADSDMQLYGFDRNCMYMQHKGNFYDVAPYAGVDDLENGRAIAILDVENDGKMDIVIGNIDAPMILYRNISEVDGNWIGLDLVNKNGTPYHGAIVTAARSDGVNLREELFIGNGGRGISDPRIHFGLGDHTIKNNQVIVTWPDGKFEVFNNVEINQYNKIMYGKGEDFI
jgi:hypothetical protein